MRSGGGVATTCDIVERTPLNSPVGAILKTLKVGSVLEVVLDTSGGRTLLAVESMPGTRVGSLTPKSLAKLIECIEQGNHYIAVIDKVTGGMYEVEVRRRPS